MPASSHRRRRRARAAADGLEWALHATGGRHMASVTTRLGELKGVDLEGCERYAGIRYAKAPVGARRFLPPEPVEAWDGVYDATSFGAAAPQAVATMPGVGIEAGQAMDEDC